MVPQREAKHRKPVPVGTEKGVSAATYSLLPEQAPKTPALGEMSRKSLGPTVFLFQKPFLCLTLSGELFRGSSRF